MKSKKIIRINLAGRIFMVLALLVVLLLESVVLIRDFDLSKEEIMHFKKSSTKEKSILIEPWMTFNYINKIFDLDASYLQTKLSISDNRYPNLEIRRYTKKNSINQDIFIQNIILLIKTKQR